MHRPDLTVVVIVQDDRHLLRAAVLSVTRQTLRNIEILIVDHASTDGTGEVADRLEQTDDRIRVIHLPDRDGGPGRPCNAGFAAAAAPYVTLCASDDELPRDACRRLLAAAELHDADLVLGRTIRIHPERDNHEQLWLHTMYEEEAAYDGIRARSGLLRDQISAAKLYSVKFTRRHGLAFPEDVIYEDQLFTLSCCVLARRIVVVPDIVYFWMIRTAGKPSITHTRSEIANLRDRIEVNTRMDQFLRDHDAEDLAPVKDAKFIEHDLRLYLRELWHRPAQYQRDFIDVVADYVTSFPYSVAEQLPTIYRVVLFMLRNRDLDGTLSACEYVREPGRVSSELTRRGDRIYWGTKYLDDAQARDWLDVTRLELHHTPFSQQRLYNYFSSYTVDGSTVRVTGVLHNQLGQIDAEDLRMDLLMRRRSSSAPLVIAIDAVRWGPVWIEYDATLDFGALPSGALPNDTWDLTLRTHSKGHTNATHVCMRDEGLHQPVALRPTRAMVGGHLLEPFATRNGDLAFRTRFSSRHTRRAATRAARLLRPALKLVRASARRARRKTRALVYRTMLTRLPVDDSLVFFEAFQGRQASDNPRAVFETLREARPDLTPVWSLTPTGRRSADLPKGTRVVTRGSWAYYLALARARFWVDNFGIPTSLGKRKGTTYLQTWHGTPAKRMFFETARVRAADDAEKVSYQRLVDRWDLLVAPSPFFEHTMVRSANFGGTLLRTGAPRNDSLVRARDAGLERATASLRRELDLPTDRKILLFAPTYRAPGPASDAYTPLDLELLADAAGEQWYVLCRDHYYDKPARLAAGLRYFARDMSSYPDLNALFLASDALLTDFSSMSFDYALLRRPMVFYAPDLDHYSTVDPLTYFHLPDVMPGPVARTQDQVVAALGRIAEGHAEHAGRYEEFLTRFAPLEDGRASEAVVDAVWGSGSTATGRTSSEQTAQTKGGRPAMVIRSTVRHVRGLRSP